MTFPSNVCARSPEPRSTSSRRQHGQPASNGENPTDLDELDLVPIDPIPSRVWYADMADFAQQVSNDAARQRLARALRPRPVPPVQGRALREVPGPGVGVAGLP